MNDGLITEEQAKELLKLPLQEGESAAGRMQIIMELLDPDFGQSEYEND